MSKTPISTVVSRQIPEYIRDEYGAFVDFIKAYYQFLEETHTEGAQPNYKDLEALHSIEDTLEVFVVQFKKELSALFPTNQLADERFVLQRLREFFKTRGSEESYKFIFRAFFNEDVTITHPSENILKASDGNWEQSNFITVEQTQTGLAAGNTISQLIISNDFGVYTLDVTQSVKINDTLRRFYFKTTTNLTINENDIVRAYNAAGGVIYSGKIILSPHDLSIVVPGNNWKRGQVFIVGSTTTPITLITTNSIDVTPVQTVEPRPTIVRVLQVSPIGAVELIEIIEHGYNHVKDEIIKTSPFEKPSVISSSIEEILVSTGPNVFNYNIILTDGVASIDSTIGITNAKTAESYFSEEYAIPAEFYAGSIAFVKAETIGTNISESQSLNSSVTLQQYNESRLQLVYNFDSVVKGKGKYTNDAGQISNQQTRIQDSYYYQLFSYLIESREDRSNYKDLLTIVHPSGLKLFSQILKEISTEFSTIASSAKSIDVKFIFDTAFGNDTNGYSNRLTKNFSGINETVVTGESTAAQPKTIGKNFAGALETVVTGESTAAQPKTIGKNLAGVLEAITASESRATMGMTINKTVSTVTETVAPTDLAGRINLLNKTIVTEIVTASSTDTTTVEYLGYATDYFSENYSAIVTTLTIGP